MDLQLRKSSVSHQKTQLTTTNSEINRLNPFMAQNKGYSSAIDLWSIGCVSALMLTGSLAFNHRDGDQDIGQINSRSISAYDLTQIDQGNHSWEWVPKRARKFVTSLLELQEDKRSTAKKALEHDWFTHDICSARFDAVYETSTRDWKPSATHKEDTIVNIDTSDIAVPTPSASQVVRQRSDSAVCQSKFFQAQDEDEGTHRDSSSTPGRFSEHEPDSNIVLAASPASQLTQNPPQSSDPNQDLDSLKPSAQLKNLQASPEFTWPSSPPNNRRKRLPSSEFPWS